MRRLLAIIAFFSVTLLAQRSNYNGTWKAQLATPAGKTENVLVLKASGDKLTGTLKNDAGEFPVQNGSVEGDDVFFTVMVKRNGAEFKMTYRGHMFGNEEIQFKIESGDDIFDMVAQKIP